MSAIPARLMHRTALIPLIAVAGVACSSAQLDESLRDQAQVELERRLASAGFEVEESSTGCAVEQLGQPTAMALAGDEFGGEFGEEEALLVAEALVDCDEAPISFGPLLRTVAPAASPQSLDCAAGELGDATLSDLLAVELTGPDGLGPADELEVTTALALCLTPEELLEFHR